MINFFNKGLNEIYSLVKRNYSQIVVVSFATLFLTLGWGIQTKEGEAIDMVLRND